MQGIQVSSMIEWTVDRNAPLKAYKNLDLASGSYHTANETLRAMTSAIVRNQIANNTIDHIIRNRQELRETVMTNSSILSLLEMNPETADILEKYMTGRYEAFLLQLGRI